jgi:hypothetical protein
MNAVRKVAFVVGCILQAALGLSLRRTAGFLAALNAIMLAVHVLYSPWPPIALTGVVIVTYGIASALAPRQAQPR